MPKIDPHPRTVAKLAPIEGRRTRYTFTGIRGLQLDCIPDGTPLGTRHWRVRYYVGESERTDTLGTFNDNDREGYVSLAKATELAAERRRSIKVEGVDPRNAEVKFADLYGRWLEQHAKVNKGSWESDVAMYHRHVEKRLGGVAIAELRRQKIIAALNDIVKAASGIQANRAQALISAVLNWSLSEGLIEFNPAHGIQKRVKEVARHRVLSDGELRRWWHALDNHCTPRVAAILQLLLLTGMRLSDVRVLRIADLHGDVWELPKIKGGLPHTTPLTTEMQRIIKAAIAISQGSPFVFPGIDRGNLTGGPMSRYTPDAAYAALAVELGMVELIDGEKKPDTGIHDLRRTMATRLAGLGVDESLIDRIQGRVKRGGVGWVYNRHAYLSERRAALEAWERELFRIVGAP